MCQSGRRCLSGILLKHAAVVQHLVDGEYLDGVGEGVDQEADGVKIAVQRPQQQGVEARVDDDGHHQLAEDGLDQHLPALRQASVQEDAVHGALQDSQQDEEDVEVVQVAQHIGHRGHQDGRHDAIQDAGQRDGQVAEVQLELGRVDAHKAFQHHGQR